MNFDILEEHDLTAKFATPIRYGQNYDSVMLLRMGTKCTIYQSKFCLQLDTLFGYSLCEVYAIRVESKNTLTPLKY